MPLRPLHALQQFEAPISFGMAPKLHPNLAAKSPALPEHAPRATGALPQKVRKAVISFTDLVNPVRCAMMPNMTLVRLSGRIARTPPSLAAGTRCGQPSPKLKASGSTTWPGTSPTASQSNRRASRAVGSTSKRARDNVIDFASHLNAGDRPRVGFGQLRSFPLALPPKNEQARIANRLDDDPASGISAMKFCQEKPRLGVKGRDVGAEARAS